QKALLLDMVYLQQDAFDAVDSSMALERQLESFALIKGLIAREYDLPDKDHARAFFTRLTGLYKNLNYSPKDSPQYADYRTQIGELLAGATAKPTELAETGRSADKAATVPPVSTQEAAAAAGTPPTSLPTGDGIATPARQI